MNVIDFESDELLQKIIKVMAENSTYQTNIERASHIFKSQPLMGKDLAGYWVDHVLRFGGRHFRSQAFNIPLYEYLLVDVVLFIFVIALILSCILIACLHTLYTNVCGSDMKKEKVS